MGLDSRICLVLGWDSDEKSLGGGGGGGDRWEGRKGGGGRDLAV